MDFNTAIQIVLKFEGGLTIDPYDVGGVTNFGISSKSYPKLNIQALTKDDAVAIYKSDFWDKYKVQNMPDKLRLSVIDALINHGPTITIKTIQAILGVTVDGIIGQETLIKMSAVDSVVFLEAFTLKRFEIYLGSRNYGRYIEGWTRRLFEVVFRSIN